MKNFIDFWSKFGPYAVVGIGISEMISGRYLIGGLFMTIGFVMITADKEE